MWKRPSTRILRRTAVVVPLAGAVAVAATVGTGAAMASTPSAPAAGSVVPDQDPFYAAPANISSLAPGDVVATRPFTPKGVPNVSAWQISYRTNDSHNQPELAVTTLLVPTAAWTGTGPRPVVSVQVAEDSTGTQCAPSYGLAANTLYAGSESALFVKPDLAKGWAVAAPDFEGPKSVFMGGIQAGHAVLDGIRAVKHANLGSVDTSNPWALDGYSGGAEATGWAAQLQPSYAPDDHLVGVAMGGTPADPAAVARSLDGGVFSGFELAATASYNVEYPEAGIAAMANATGTKALQDGRGKCLTDLLVPYAFKKLSSFTTVPDPLSVPSVAAVLKANTIGAAAPAAPIYDFHAGTDEIVPVGQDNTMVAAWCSNGATVQKVRDLVGEHALEALVRQNDKIAFLADRFAGKAPVNTC